MPDPAETSAPLSLPPTSWNLWRRAVPFTLLPLVLSAFFFYDWKIGYPNRLHQYEEFQRYKAEGKNQEWVIYSAAQGWDKEPEEMHQGKIDEQLYYGIGSAVLGVASLLYYLLNYPRKLTADATSFTPPGGPRIPFSSVHRIDKRPWKLKGLAKVFYTLNGKNGQTAIDDLRFAGAETILQRLESNFTGEILDHEEEPPPAQA